MISEKEIVYIYERELVKGGVYVHTKNWCECLMKSEGKMCVKRSIRNNP